MAETETSVYLIDASSYIFRAFFAIPPLTNSAGLPTHAVYGFTSLTLKFINQYRPEYLAVVLDAGRETFRNEIYRAYKENRPEAPPQLIPQFPYIRKVLEALNLPLLEMRGFEADDIIGTLTKTFSSQGIKVIVVSSDKDLMQLVTDGVRLLDSAKGKWIGYAEIKQKFGVEPHRVIEVMGLMGDSVDNIPGVKGIGEKTATALIQKFETLENLFDHLDEVETMGLKGAARIRNALAEGKESAFLSRTLATVKLDVPVETNLADLRYRRPDIERARALFAELEFHNLLKMIEEPELEQR
jgi:DNA polymerase-1